MLEIKDLHASINGKEILKGINLNIKKGEVHASWDRMAPVRVHCHLYW